MLSKKHLIDSGMRLFRKRLDVGKRGTDNSTCNLVWLWNSHCWSFSRSLTCRESPQVVVWTSDLVQRKY